MLITLWGNLPLQYDMVFEKLMRFATKGLLSDLNLLYH